MSWNPVRGCSRVSEGCRFCYAETMAARFSDPGQWGHGFATRTKAGGRWTGRVRLIESKLNEPSRVRKPQRIFVNSTSDLWHESLGVTDILRVYDAMRRAPHHIYQVLTKRPARRQRVLYALNQPPLPHVWEGTSIESAEHLDRLEDLRNTPAAVRFLSCEPLLEDLGALDLSAIRWVIVGGESGHGARPMHPDWARSIRDQCQDQGVPYFHKQNGVWLGISPYYTPNDEREEALENWRGPEPRVLLPSGGWWQEDHQPAPGSWFMARVGKKAAGRLIDGREWNEMPEVKR